MAIFSFLFYSCEKDVDEPISTEAGTEDTALPVGADQAIPGEYIVIYKEDKALSGKSAEMEAKSQSVLSKYAISTDHIKQIYRRAIQGFAVENLSAEQVDMLKRDPAVAYIEPNYIQKLDIDMGKPVSTLPKDLQNNGETSRTTNDAQLSNGEFLPWGVNRVGRASGSGRTCWIIDSGIAPHSDLIIDTARSVSFVGGSWQDQNGHGTHVAGTVAARNNGSGVIGVAYDATVISVRVLDAAGSGPTSSILAGIDYVANNAGNTDTWNYSVGFRNRYTSQTIDDAFRNLETTAYGAMAAGNSNDDTQFYSPQRLQTSNSWCIGNMTNVDAPASGSNFGSSVDRWAPGTAVWSTWLNGQFNNISGTSMASPHVAGILLLRGNSTGTDGSVTKGGSTAPIATLN